MHSAKSCLRRGSNAGNIASPDAGRLRRDLLATVDGEVRFDTLSRALYATDASNYRQIPLGVVIPKNREAVVRAVEVCRAHDAPLVSRGGGTALAGQGCNVAVMLDFSKYLHHILELDPERRIARVEPGIILDHLRDAAEEHNLTFGPDPATHNHCTLGGMLGNNSCGIHAVMAGCTVANVVEMEVLTYDGQILRVGPTGEKELEEIISRDDRRGRIYSGLKRIRDRYADLIRERYPDIPRRVSGYNLDQLLPENGFNVARALVGSESTCVTILEATVRLVHSPPERVLVALGYPDIFVAGDRVPEIMRFKPIGLEGIDDKLINFMKIKHLHPEDIELLPPGKGWLLVEFGADTLEEAKEKARETMETLRNESDPPNMKLFHDKAEEKKVWEIRESGLGATANIPNQPLTWPGFEDAAVAPDEVGQYLREFRELMHEFGYSAALYGHFGQGCIHCRINFDLLSKEGIDTYMKFIDRAADLVVRHRGSISGEHGDGQSKASLLEKMFGPDILEAFKEFKELWDPARRMNPGKVVDACLPDDNLRLGESYSPWQPATHYAFPDDEGSFSRATLRCVGVGKCRRTHDAFMCPSFLVTREEKHTTRGRAHALFEMFRGDFITDGWKSKEVMEALDLCLACKGCKTECPVDVDIATYKSEFLSHHFDGRFRPRSHYSMGLIGWWSKIASLAPGLTNALGSAPLLGSALKAAAGIAVERPLPKFARQTFTSWYSLQQNRFLKGEPVVLFPDLFNDHFYPETLKAAALLLKRWGYAVHLPGPNMPTVRPLLHYGLLPMAKKQLKRCIRMLAPFVRRGIQVVVLEPSTASAFRDELLQLFPHDRDGRRIADHVRLLSEFVEEHDLPVPRLEGKAIFHAHCHQKSVLRPNAARNILHKMGLKVAEPQKTCCGMAGSFGFEAKHYPISIQVADTNLYPSVRHSSLDTWIVADGFSCRTQIKDGTDREAHHMANLISEGFQLNERGITSNARRRAKATRASRPEVVVVTGASAGLGRAIVQIFARHGAKIGLVARGLERLEETQREVEYLGGEAVIIQGDVADPETTRRAVAETEKAFGPLDIWVNNAMATVFSEFKDVTPEEFKRVTEVTYLGFVYGTKAALDAMLPRDHGVIVQVGSALAKRSIPLQSPYCGAKHGIEGFTDSIRSEMLHEHRNIHLTVVEMPALNTPQFEWGRSHMHRKPQPVAPIFQPEVGAEAVYWAAHKRLRSVSVGLSTLEAIVGNKFIPGSLDKYLARTNFKAQQTDEPDDPNRPDNLFTPVEGIYSAHGPFDAKARKGSFEFAVSKHRRAIGIGAAALTLGIGAGFLLRTLAGKRES